MPTLRQHVRDALSAGEPSAGEAAADLDAIVMRARGGRRRRSFVYAAAMGSVCAAALAGWLTVPKPRPARGVHLYLHVAGEPESQAMMLDLTSEGDAR